MCEIQNHRVLDYTSHPASAHALLIPVANQDGGILTYFDDPWKIEDLTKPKIFCGKLLQKTSCIILGKKKLLSGAL